MCCDEQRVGDAGTRRVLRAGDGVQPNDACNACDGWAVREFGVPSDGDLTDEETSNEFADLLAMEIYP